jgi:hypothetical protein
MDEAIRIADENDVWDRVDGESPLGRGLAKRSLQVEAIE